MSPELVGALGIAFLLTLMMLGVPIAITFIMTGFFGIVYLNSFSAAMHVIVTAPFGTSAYFPFLAIPLFILMGNFCFYGGISEDFFVFLYRTIGRFRGGLAMATVGACAGFAAVSGSSMATSAAIGKVTYGEMRKYKYDAKLATGTIAAGGTLGALIPPSIIFIIYGIIVNESIGKLFISGFLPGFLQAGLYILGIYIVTRRNPALGPPGPAFTGQERLRALPRVLPGATLSLIVLVGIYAGIFTPTEAAAIGAFCSFVYLLARRRLTRDNFIATLLETGRITAMIFFILMGATVFNTFMAASGLPKTISQYLSGLALPAYGILAMILFFYLVLGCFMDAMGMLLLTLPIFVLTYQTLGFNLVWIGVLTVRMVEIGSLTPPLGLHCFVVAGIARDVPLSDIFRGIVSFLIMDLISLPILVAFPQISLWLPSMMMK